MKMPDLDKAFPKTPSYVHRCVLAAFEEGERRADRKKRRLTAICCAAAMLLVFIAGGFAVSNKLLTSPDSLLPLSAASTSPTSTPSATPDPDAADMTWYDPGTSYAVSAARLYVDGLDECYGRTDSVSCPDLSTLITDTLTAQNDLTAYMSDGFMPSVVLEIDYSERNGNAETGTVCVRLNLNNGLNLFYSDGCSWALENGCDALFEAMNVDTDLLQEAQAIAQTISSTPAPIATDDLGVTVEPTADSSIATHMPDPTPVPADTEAVNASSEAVDTVWPDGAAFTPEDIHDLTRVQLFIEGQLCYEYDVDDSDILTHLEKLLSGAVPSEDDIGCPYGPRLYLTRTDGTTGYIEPAYDCCGRFRSGDTDYAYSADGSYTFWDIMGIPSDEVLQLMLDSSDDTIFVVPGSTYYHVFSDCDALSYELSAYTMLSGDDAVGDHIDGSIIRSLSDADGLTPCASCAQVVYSTEDDLFYHAASTCVGTAGASECTVTAAQTAGKSPCPICIDDAYADLLSERALVLLVPSEEGAGEYYHGNANCARFLLEAASAARTTADGSSYSLSDWCLSVEEAEAEGALPCEYCTKESVYATPNGTWYHTDPACSGMMNADSYTVMQAESEGKTACPVCCDELEVFASPTPVPESEDTASGSATN